MTKSQMQSIVTAVLTAMEAVQQPKAATKQVRQAYVKPVKLAEGHSNVDAKTDRALKTAAAVVRAFKKAGYGDVQPRVDVQTYNRWLAAGLKVRVGEKSVKVGTLRLFHVSQCEAYVQPKAENVVIADVSGPAAIDKTGKLVFVSKIPMGVSGNTSKLEGVDGQLPLGG
jgi:hypothetical protein